jgi:hypothetical protein
VRLLQNRSRSGQQAAHRLTSRSHGVHAAAIHACRRSVSVLPPRNQSAMPPNLIGCAATAPLPYYGTFSDVKEPLKLLRSCGHKPSGHYTRPNWTCVLLTTNCEIEITSEQSPVGASLWWADAPTRDFRGARWQSRPINNLSKRFSTEIPRPINGYRAAYVSLTYREMPVGFEVSTQISVFGTKSTSDPTVTNYGD